MIYTEMKVKITFDWLMMLVFLSCFKEIREITCPKNSVIFLVECQGIFFNVASSWEIKIKLIFCAFYDLIRRSKTVFELLLRYVYTNMNNPW